MKNHIIKGYRERLKGITKDRAGIQKFIEKNKVVIEEYYKKYFEIEEARNSVAHKLKMGNINQLNKDSLFLYSDKNEKIPLMNARILTENVVKRELEVVDRELNAYKKRIIDLCEMVQLDLHKLELIEETFYKICYTIEYLEIGEKAIELNNKMRYCYYFIIYFNSFSGFESNRSKLNPVYFTEKEIEKFIYENKNMDI